ncbi:transcriptional regulator, GntR family with aminotransferase domain [Catenulispora acidiphila DSM 44928]|uniref:Transcriptional regulator, GntR family with aminotransferase domain n=1 Tax=Catenulispora acidiphila (strain DSM 44928 / JCM 14897 / NBRC 102108 / NRRL B-24433 / ID139908) TaxID=479433 RepID=C7QBW4_CATAD|nr:PLP-dependent aminotransferase family protein [Catenulispora acidiphila]ACU72583.1 transcriptional regulator, GntR family with aminotransferase domain [Catenulispora acidiphila DSM 44928]
MAEVLVELDRAAGRLVAQLVAGLRDAVREGRLAGGTVLPPSRQLAAELRVSRGIVVEAYQQLVAEGYLLSRVGSGTRVAEGLVATAAGAVGATADAGSAAPPRYDLTPGSPDLSLFPRSAWLAAMRRAVSTLPNSDLGYGDPAGVLRFREEMAAYLSRVRAADAVPERIVALNGAAHGLALGLRALREDGHRVLAVEDPSGDRPRQILGISGLDLAWVPVDDDGLIVSELRKTAATVVHVTPAHQYPTGTALSPGRRAELVAWAREVDGIIIEDDYDAEFRYDRDPIACLQGLGPDRVLYLGTASKSLAPALRLGWALAPAPLAERLRALRKETDLGGPILEHVTLAELIASGAYDRHLRGVRRRYRERRDALAAALAERLPHWRVRGIAAGLHLLVDLPPAVDEEVLTTAARAHGVRVQPLAPMRCAPGPPGLVLGYAGLSPAHLAEAVRLLHAAARSCDAVGPASGKLIRTL